MKPSEHNQFKDTFSMEFEYHEGSEEFGMSYNDSIFKRISGYGVNMTDRDNELFENEGKSLKIERLLMKIEDFYSFLAGDKTSSKKKTLPDSKYCSENYSEFKENDSTKLMIFNTECRLSELYQLKDDLDHFISLVESDAFCCGKIYFRNLRLDLKVNQNDFPFVKKDLIFKNFKTPQTAKTKDPFTQNFPNFAEYFKNLEENMILSYENTKLNIFSTQRSEARYQSIFLEDLSTNLLKKLKIEEENSRKEIEWQLLEAKLKKWNYTEKFKILQLKEEDLKRLSKNISKETVKQAKEREILEQLSENFEVIKYNHELVFNKKIDYINEALQTIEDSKCEGLKMHDLAISPNKNPYPSITDDIKTLENELKVLEVEYKSSKFPENLESLQTNINRLKSSILNLKSLNALQKTERTSSALRNNLNKLEKQFDSSTESTTSKNSLNSYHSESLLTKNKKLPYHPLPASIRISPLKKLELSTNKLNVSELNTPSKRRSLLESPKNNKEDTQLIKTLRVKEQILREREEELEEEEKKSQML